MRWIFLAEIELSWPQVLKQKIKTCSEFSFGKRIRGLAPKLAELEPFLCEWWKILDFSCIGRFQQIYVSCRIFIFRRHGHIFWPKLVLFFSLTHKLLIFYVYEVASILIHSGLRQKRISWGGYHKKILILLKIDGNLYRRCEMGHDLNPYKPVYWECICGGASPLVCSCLVRLGPALKSWRAWLLGSVPTGWWTRERLSEESMQIRCIFYIIGMKTIFFTLMKNLPRFLCNHVYMFFSLKSFATRWSFILLENLWNILLAPWFVSLEVRPSCLYKEFEP